jgi:hypothetical protein
MNTTNYIQLINYLNDFATQHKQVKRFDSDFTEQLNNYATSDKAYPLLYASPQPSFFLDDDTWSNYTIEVTCLDILQKDRSNVNTILNNCSLILNDLNTYLKDNEIEGVYVEGISNITPLNNYLVDYDAGWSMTINFQVVNNSVCDIPLISPIGPGGGECLPAEITLNGDAFLEVISGGTEDISLIDQDSNPIVPTSVVGSTITVNVSCDHGLKVVKTNQLGSFTPGDDGTHKSGREVDSSTLDYNNLFGNTNRFTDLNGGSLYSDDILLDWSTWDGEEVMGVYIIKQGLNLWPDAVSLANSFSVGSFTSGWRLPTWLEFSTTFMRIGYTRALNWAPFNNAANDRFWTNSSAENYTDQPLFFENQWGMTRGNITSQNWAWYPIRYFTNAELGF